MDRRKETGMGGSPGFGWGLGNFLQVAAGRWRRGGKRGRGMARSPWLPIVVDSLRIERRREEIAGGWDESDRERRRGSRRCDGIEDDEGGKGGSRSDRSTALIPIVSTRWSLAELDHEEQRFDRDNR